MILPRLSILIRKSSKLSPISLYLNSNFEYRILKPLPLMQVHIDASSADEKIVQIGCMRLKKEL